LTWDITVEGIARKIKRMEKGQIDKGRRDGAAQFHVREVEGDHSVHVTAAASDGSPVAEGDCGTPVGHGTMRIGGYFVFECEERLSIMMKWMSRGGEGKIEEQKEHMERKRKIEEQKEHMERKRKREERHGA